MNGTPATNKPASASFSTAAPIILQNDAMCHQLNAANLSYTGCTNKQTKISQIDAFISNFTIHRAKATVERIHTKAA